MKRRQLLALTFLAMQVLGQTRIDVQSQSQGFGFLEPPFNRPVRLGTSLPQTCEPGELYFLSSSPPGANLHVCYENDQWAPQGSAGLSNIAVRNAGVLTGTRSSVNFSAGPGIVALTGDSGSAIDVQFDLDTASVLTHSALQGGESLHCLSTSISSGAHGCNLMPALTAYRAGMVIRWQPDADSDGNILTLDVNQIGAKEIKREDGIANPKAGDIRSDRMYPLWYDGTQFRLIPSVVPDAFATKDAIQDGSLSYCFCESGSGSEYTCDLASPMDSYREGMLIYWRPDVPVAGGATLNIDGLGSRPIQLPNGSSDLALEDIVAGNAYLVWFDGLVFRVMNPEPQSGLVEQDLQSGRALICESQATVGQSFQCDLSPAASSLPRGALLHWVPDQSLIGPTTLEVGLLGSYDVKRADGITDPHAGDASAGQMVFVWFDGTRFRLADAISEITTGPLRPTCDATTRGRTWFTRSGPSEKDEYSVCVKDEVDSYVWHYLY